MVFRALLRHATVALLLAALILGSATWLSSMLSEQDGRAEQSGPGYVLAAGSTQAQRQARYDLAEARRRLAAAEDSFDQARAAVAAADRSLTAAKAAEKKAKADEKDAVRREQATRENYQYEQRRFAADKQEAVKRAQQDADAAEKAYKQDPTPANKKKVSQAKKRLAAAKARTSDARLRAAQDNYHRALDAASQARRTTIARSNAVDEATARRSRARATAAKKKEAVTAAQARVAEAEAAVQRADAEAGEGESTNGGNEGGRGKAIEPPTEASPGPAAPTTEPEAVNEPPASDRDKGTGQEAATNGPDESAPAGEDEPVASIEPAEITAKAPETAGAGASQDTSAAAPETNEAPSPLVPLAAVAVMVALIGGGAFAFQRRRAEAGPVTNAKRRRGAAAHDHAHDRFWEAR